MQLYMPGALLPVQVPASALGKRVQEEPSIRTLGTHGRPGLHPATALAVVAIWEVNPEISIAPSSSFLTLQFPINQNSNNKSRHSENGCYLLGASWMSPRQYSVIYTGDSVQTG